MTTSPRLFPSVFLELRSIECRTNITFRARSESCLRKWEICENLGELCMCESSRFFLICLLSNVRISRELADLLLMKGRQSAG